MQAKIVQKPRSGLPHLGGRHKAIADAVGAIDAALHDSQPAFLSAKGPLPFQANDLCAGNCPRAPVAFRCSSSLGVES